MPTSRPAAFHLLLCGALVLYVYRVFAVGANLSLFRMVLAAWTVVAIAGLVRGRTPLSRLHVVLAGIVAAIVALNAVDFAGLDAYPVLRRDILNHLQNLWFAGLIAIRVRTDAAVVSLLTAFVWSSALTSAVTLASWLLGRLPFEPWLRRYAGPYAQGLNYLGSDPYFHRATSAFFDPNFYGIFSALVILTAIWLWARVERRPWLLTMVAVNVGFLGASLSRTGLVGLLGALAVAAVVHRRVPGARQVVALTAVAACAAILTASVVQSRANRARFEAWRMASTAQGEAADPSRATGARRDPRAAPPPDKDRLTGSASVADRFRRIRHGWRVFLSAPWLGRGGAALLSPEFPPHASAHLVYLTLLARYGIVGTLVYGAYGLLPLVTIARRRASPADALLVTVAACLALVFVSYDVFLGFEIPYVFFGVAWAVAARPPEHRARLAPPA